MLSSIFVTKLFCKIFDFFLIYDTLKLTCESMGNHKTWNIWKTAGRRANGWKFGTRGPRNSLCRVLFGSGRLSSVWGSIGALCKISDVKIFKRLLVPPFSSDFNQTLWKVWWSGEGGYRLLLLLAIRQKLKKKLWHFDIFVKTGPYGAGNFKTRLLLHFSLKVNQTSWGHWQPWVNTLLLFLAIGQVLKNCGTSKF